MMKQYNRVCARIDLDAIEYNMEMMHKNTREGVSMISVIKTDGYGHGAVQIARMLEPKDYIWGYAVATLDEAVVLRKRGIKKPILVLGCIFPDQWEAAITHEIRFTVYTKEMAEGISELAGKLGKDAYVHIKLDTIHTWERSSPASSKKRTHSPAARSISSRDGTPRVCIVYWSAAFIWPPPGRYSIRSPHLPRFPNISDYKERAKAGLSEHANRHTLLSDLFMFFVISADIIRQLHQTF